MMNKIVKSQKSLLFQARMLSYNYRHANHPKVWLEVNKDGASAGKMVIELYESHSPALTENFVDLLTGQRSIVGTSFEKGLPGMGIQGGDLHECENWGANNARLSDENLELRHHKRGLVTMVNDGSHANGSQFMITFGEANYLNGYNNIIGEVVEGHSVLDQLEASCDRQGHVHGKWTIAGAGHHH